MTDNGFHKLCDFLQSVHANELFLGVSANKLSKGSVPYLTNLAHNIKIDKLHLGTILISDWDKHDYDSVMIALKDNPNLKSFMLNNMRV